MTPNDCKCRWWEIEVINFFSNKPKILPDMLTKRTRLKRIFLNNNLQSFDVIPARIEKLANVEAAYNLDGPPKGCLSA